MHRPDITDRLPTYRLLRSLSHTAMSEVFLAEDIRDNRQVALKVVGPQLVRKPGFRDRFEWESEIALSLKHPNIVPAHEAGQSDDGELCYLAMDYVDGQDLGEILGDGGTLDLDTTLTVARQVAAALDAAHGRGLIHRDVKPGNILVERGTNRVYLCDFGIVKDPTRTAITLTGAFVGTRGYSAPEQLAGADVDRRADVYSLGSVIYHCLTGQLPSPGAAGRLATRRGGPLPGPVARVLGNALASDPADRYATCRQLVDGLADATRAARSRWARFAPPALVGLGVAAMLVLVSVALADRTPEPVAPQGLPAALREHCQVAGTPLPGASSTVSCRDAAGPDVVSALYTDRSGTDAAYARALDESGVSPNQGDCLRAAGAEHRYPATGPARGRVLCYARGGQAVIVWTDSAARTLNRAESSTEGYARLSRSWSTWTGAPAFPTAEERQLLDVAAGSSCARAPVVDLDAFAGAVAGVTCTPTGSGARSVSYFRFASLADLRASFTGRVRAARAPSGVSCTGATTPFLGTHRHDWLTVDLGQVLCEPGPASTLAMDWSVESLSMIGRVVGDERAALASWWSQWHLAPLDRIVAAANAQAVPRFPTEAEQRLLAHIPPISRVHCVRPSPDQVWQDVGAVPAVGVACGRTSGAEMVVYYQFPDAATMRSVYNGNDFGPPCTSLPSDFSGDRPYSRGGHTGQLRCGVREDTGERFLEWTDDRLSIQVYAHRGTEPFAMIDWWTHDAGPI